MMLARFYTTLLRLYPRRFRAKFGKEMQSVFEEAAATPTGQGLKLSLFLRELRDLPGSLFHAYLADWLRGGNISLHNEYISPSTKWQAFLGILPFLTFGIASLISKFDQNLPIRGHNVEMAVYALALVGLLIGWLRHFPLWSYSYLGWSLLLAWSNTNARSYGVEWGYLPWIPFGITVLIAFLWTRSIVPIRQFLRDVWNDWTRLTLAMFALGSWLFLIYDENHHPYLLWFMLVTILVVSGGAWFFLRSTRLKGRIISIIGSFVSSAIVSWVCEATWDWHAYYGFPQSEQTWYQTLGIYIMLIAFWLVILFWPALIALIQRIANRRIV